MSYARFGWDGSDVYVFDSVNGGFECCGCLLDGGLVIFPLRTELIAHLREHQAAGHTVPDYVFTELKQEINDIGNEWSET